ncbi:recombinase family protein [Kitasatospora cineracea]|uniref:DNA invertase Pin-like site-specific DNA recombinase n=1 Tax=Kitasatospora cineracea TaxID=88074 RepID=A0A8G1XBL7_9ACTN|nr:DNA invertase Pin-like site-specific DNA recombinase [Kitasatospora cineracea]
MWVSICRKKETRPHPNGSRLVDLAVNTEPKRTAPRGHWRENDLALLDELLADERRLLRNAPRALLSVRLSSFTADTTSPVRQELDLRRLARERGFRVVGVAGDLNVSATRVPPWKRRQLGHWLVDRVPDFDVLLFWKLDRFVRRLTDLSVMIEWCTDHGKNLVSLHEAIDLSTAAGKEFAKVIGGVAEIEAGGTSTRVTSLWAYAKTQPDWLVGRPPYGYATDAGGRLVIEPGACRVLRWCHGAALRGVSARRMVAVLVRAGISTGGGGRWTATTLLRRLRNPALCGWRVEAETAAGTRRSRVVLDRKGAPIRVAEPIFSAEEWQSLQSALGRRAVAQPRRSPDGATEFLGVLVCADCGTNMTVQRTRTDQRVYVYLRCRTCPSGGLGAPRPSAVHGRLSGEVLAALGALPVRVREYRAGAVGANGSSEEAGWTLSATGETFGDRWQREGTGSMAEDLRRARVTCRVRRTKVPGRRAPEVDLELVVPPDVEEALVIKPDVFAVRLP